MKFKIQVKIKLFCLKYLYEHEKNWSKKVH